LVVAVVVLVEHTALVQETAAVAVDNQVELE
jgi:hypothetical protein